MEVILVNDASTDGSSRVCHKYAARDNRIIVIDKPRNEGLELARRSGLDIARGRYVIHVDSDDWLDNRHVLSTMYRTAEETGADYVKIAAQRVVDRYKFFTTPIPAAKNGLIEQPELFDLLYDAMIKSDVAFASIWGKLYRKSVVDKAGIQPAGISMGEDVAYNIQLFPHLEKIYVIDEVGYNYRYGGMCRRYDPRSFEDLKHLYGIKRAAISKFKRTSFDSVNIELKNILKAEICRRIEFTSDSRPSVVEDISREIRRPLYDNMLEVDKASGFWNDPFVAAFEAGDSEALYEICRQIVRKEHPGRVLKHFAAKIIQQL